MYEFLRGFAFVVLMGAVGGLATHTSVKVGLKPPWCYLPGIVLGLVFWILMGML